MLHDLNARAENTDATALVARQPIFDLQGAVWGYELLFRDPSLRPGLAGKSSEAATSTVMVYGFELMRPLLRGRQRFFINFTSEFLQAELPAILPPEVCVIEILEDSTPTPQVLQGLGNLKKKGYMLALDDYTGQPELEPFIPLVDIVKVDVLGSEAEDIARLSAFLAPHGKRLLAEKVEDAAMAQTCRDAGFSLFQGFFFSRAEVVSGKKLNPAQVTKARLLALCAREDAELQDMEELISGDVYLSYQLLKYINSLYFGLPTRVVTVEHAVSLLGLLKIKQWLFITTLASLDDSPMSQELAYISAFRGKFLELLSGNAGEGVYRSLSARLFLTGLFSLLESMLRMPLPEIFETLDLAPDIMQALSGKPGPLTPWLQLLQAYEKGQWEEVQKLSSLLRISDRELAAAYVDAGSWSAALFNPAPAH